MRDMSNIYRFKKLDELKALRMEKEYRLTQLRRQAPTYYVLAEIRRATHLLKQINAELQCRFDQMDLF